MSYEARRAARWAGVAGTTLAVSLTSGAMAGPDVIVGDIPGANNYTSGGAVGGKRAYSIGTTSCNLGDVPLTWIAGNNQHPVISQNMYRLSSGRFEQIGQAWLKHGFCALQGTVCGPCNPNPTGCPALGVGCSDPYDAGLNGDQGGLGPKFEVNASTGFFPYPFTAQGATGNAIYKRLQVNDSDLATPGALYFVSSSYIQPEDAAANNDNNNQSYRRITVAPVSRNITLTDSTQREKPAILAWKEHGLGVGLPDPAVIVSNIDVPGDGRFILAYKVTANGDGTWTYDYALQNLNSHRSGQAFTIDAAGTLSSIGFHDVEYHSGEPYSGTDWATSSAGGALTWATQTFAQNQNANALRWDTIYNFRVTSTEAPALGGATITLFRPGIPASISVPALVPGGGEVPPPFNDDCADAIAAENGTTAFFTTNASTDGPAESLCSGFGDDQLGADIWYTYTPGCDGPVSMTTCGSAFDTRLAVYAACPASPNTALLCNDDSPAMCGANSLQSAVDFMGVGGVTYLIRIGGYDDGNGPQTGAGMLNIVGPDCGPPTPENNDCADATPIGYGTHEFTTLGSDTDGPPACGEIGNDVWFAFTACANGTITVQTCGTPTGYDSVLAAYTGGCGALVERACNDDTCGLQSRITFAGVSGTQYLIRVGGYSGDVGTGAIVVSGPACASGPPNDNCNNRIGIAPGTTAFTTVNASTDGPAHAACDFFGSSQITNDIWYNHPASCTGTLTVETCGSSYDSKIAVYDGNGCENFDSRLLACNDDNDGCGAGSLQSRLTIEIVQGQNYTIRVGGYEGSTGAGTLTLSCEPATDCNENGTPDATEIAGNPALDCFDPEAPPVNGFFTRGSPNGALDMCECSADWNRDNTVGSADITAFLASWFDDLSTSQTKADFNCSGTTGSADITAYLAVWFGALSGQPPFNGCP